MAFFSWVWLNDANVRLATRSGTLGYELLVYWLALVSVPLLFFPITVWLDDITNHIVDGYKSYINTWDQMIGLHTSFCLSFSLSMFFWTPWLENNRVSHHHHHRHHHHHHYPHHYHQRNMFIWFGFTYHFCNV